MLLASPMIQRLADAAAPWQAYYADSRAASVAVAFAHVGGLLVAGGLAIGADRQALRVARDDAGARRRLVAELGTLHRPVLALLAVVAASGAAMFLADVEQFATSPVYWGKLALFAALLGNGALMRRVEARLRARADDDASWGRLRVHAAASASLWLAATLAGVLLQRA